MPVMKVRPYRQLVILLLSGIAVAVLTVSLVVHLIREPVSLSPEATAPPQEASANNLAPSLTCWFYDFTNANLVVRFDFAVALPKNAQPRFDELAEASRDGTQKTFDIEQRPTWPYAHDDEGTPMITSPDGATRIVLYGLNLNAGGASFVEAGIRSNAYRNLGGR